jgi:hypothetical protein
VERNVSAVSNISGPVFNFLAVPNGAALARIDFSAILHIFLSADYFIRMAGTLSLVSSFLA